jgi:hypothetical protein
MDLSKLQSQLDSAKSEVEQLKSGRKVSSSRARAALMKVKKESDLIRKEILTYYKNLPVKQRTKVAESPDRKTKVAVSPVIPEPMGSLGEPRPMGSVSELQPAAIIPEKPIESLSELPPIESLSEPQPMEAAPKTKAKAKPRTKK